MEGDAKGTAVTGPRWRVAAGLLPVLLLAAGAFAAPATAGTWHLDCSQPDPGDGTEASPLNTLTAANALSLGPGDRLLVRRGSTCSGLLAPPAEGTAGNPAVISAYGTGAAPAITGTGQSAMRITDARHLVIEDLDLSNPGAGEPLGEGATIRNGLEIFAATRTVEDLTVRRLRIHDVAGDLTKSAAGSSGIQVSATGAPPIRFDRLLLVGNEITDVSRSGISISASGDPNRPAASEPWPNASTGVVVRGNRIERVAGDGIVPRGTDGAIVEDNVVGHGNIAGRRLGHPQGEICNAGIWTFRSNNTVIRRNEVYGMEQHGCDGTGFDLDYNQDGTIIEQNLSHDNGGGFILFCTETVPRHGEVRFNLSVNDASTINHGPCAGHFGDLGGIRFFNNTVIAPEPNASIQLSVVTSMYLPGDFRFFNNLIYATSPQTRKLACGEFCSHNLFFGLPASGTAALTSDPLLANPLATGSGRLGLGRSFRLRTGSPARGAGLGFPDTGLRDYFGNPVEPERLPAIGFDQEPAVKPPGPGPACLKARAAHRAAVRAVRSARAAVARLKKKQARRARIHRVTRKLKRLRRTADRRTREATRRCR